MPPKFPWRPPNGDRRTWYSFPASSGIDLAFAWAPGWPVVPRPKRSPDAAPSIWIAFWRIFTPPPERAKAVDVGTRGTSGKKAEKLRFNVGRRRRSESPIVVPVPVLLGLITGVAS